MQIIGSKVPVSMSGDVHTCLVHDGNSVGNVEIVCEYCTWRWPLACLFDLMLWLFYCTVTIIQLNHGFA